MSHCSRLRTFTKNQLFSDQEIEMFHDMIAAPLVKEEPDTLEQEVEDVQPEPQAQGVPVKDVLRLMEGFTDALKNLHITVQAPTVNVEPKISLEPHTEVKRISRDERGRMESIETEIQ